MMVPFFNKHKALLMTFLFMGVLMLVLHTIVLTKTDKIPNELLFELVADQVPDSPEEKLPESKPEPKIAAVARIHKSHRAFNREAKMDEEEFNQRLEELAQKMNEGSKSISTTPNTENGRESVAPKAAENNNQPTAQQKDKKPSPIKETNVRGSSISYSLVSRKASYLPNPVYTCDRRGKIVVNIVVDQYGHVDSAVINKAASNSSNGCLHDSALKYAYRSQFSSDARARQLGTITYLFNY